MKSAVYPVPEGERIYAGYAVTVDGAPAPVSEVRCSAIPFNRRWPGHQRQIEQTELCGMVRFAFEGRATVSVTADRDFKEVKVRPLSHGVVLRRDGRTVTFEINRPGGYSVEFDGYHNNLHVFADASGAAAAPARGGNVVVFGPGAHEVGIMTLKSGDTVYIDPGAVVYGGFHAKDAEDIAIVGCGIIDGGHLKEKILFETSGDGSEDVHNATREHTVDFRNCRKVRIDGPTFRDSLLYNIAMWGCEDIDVRHVKIVGQWRFNTDGIDLHNCRRAYVSDCFARTFDDTFCFKAHEGYGNCEDGVFERCVAWNDWGKAFEVGVECRAEHLRRLAFRDCDCIHAVGTVLDVANVDYGRVSEILFEDIRVECDDPMPGQQFQKTDESPFDASAGLDSPPRLFQAAVWYSQEYSNENGGKWSGGGFIDGVTVRDVSISSAGRVPKVGIGVSALDAWHRPENIVVESLVVDGRPVADANDVVLRLGNDAPAPAFTTPDGVPRMARTIRPAGTGFCFNPDEQTFRPLSDDYAVSLNGQPVEVRACRESRIPFNRYWPGHQRPLDQTERAAYIACEADGPVACLVTPAHPFTRTVVRPLSKGVSTSVANDVISFTLPGPGYYVLETDGPHKALHIFVEKPREFPEKEQATLSYGPGMHIAGLVRLKDHDRVYIDRDAIVFGCFTGENARDVKIFGHGVIDGRVCERIFEGCYSPLQLSCLRFHGSSGISVDGPVLIDSPCWVLAFFGCEDVDVRHVKIVGQWRYNTDGIDICNSRRVTVRDSFIRSFDDTISLKGIPPLRDLPVEDVTVERCVLWCGWGKTLEPGIETWAPAFRRIRFSDCDLIRNEHAALNVSAGGTAVQEDIAYENIRVELQADNDPAIYQHSDDQHYAPARKAAPMLVKVDNVHYGRDKDEPFGHVRNCTFTDIAVFAEEGTPPPVIRVVSQTPPGGKARPFENIAFARFSINGKATDWSAFNFVVNTPIVLEEVAPVANPASASEKPAKNLDDAAKMGAAAMNPGRVLKCVGHEDGGDFKVLVYGNSIALHAPKADIGWTYNWGMAASAPEKDFAHLVVAGLEERRGGRADYRIRNIAALERDFTADLASVPELADDAAWGPDYVVIAIGENVRNIEEADAPAYRKFLADLARPFASLPKRPVIALRSPFWRNVAKARCTEEAAAEVGAVYVDAESLGDADENKALGLFTHTGVANHPGDLGMRRLADLILAGVLH